MEISPVQCQDGDTKEKKFGLGRLSQKHKKELKEIRDSCKRETGKTKTKEAKREIEKTYAETIRLLEEKQSAELVQLSEGLQIHLDISPCESSHKFVQEQADNCGGNEEEVTSKQTDANLECVEERNNASLMTTEDCYTGEIESVPFYKEREISKSQKKKNRKTQNTIEERQRILDEHADLPDLGKIESQDLENQLNKESLAIHHVASDGHCVYRSVESQLRHIQDHFCEELQQYTFFDLRRLTAAYLREHKGEFEPYLEDSYQGIDDGFEKYCATVADTAEWGGEVELHVLARVLQRPVIVHKSDGPTLTYGQKEVDEQSKPKHPIRLAYHRHLLAAGAHYNSVVTKVNTQ
eukprot:GHVQ01009357.1.p1 GENE.GHVQ01009357.1~~GHVQ01009357.1.p1  ORF type:complete len:352 (+),score=54.81 GHVQ01009357.1:2826-3881(+)